MAKSNKFKDFDPRLFHGIAHRGLWGPSVSENGLAAFANAINHNLAFELDVHLSKDKELIVCHDADLERTTGKKGYIPNLTVKEIKEGYSLLDGGEVPTLKDVLSLNNERVPIVVELKVDDKNYKELASKVMEVLSIIKNKKTITLISFDPRALQKCKKSGFSRGLLITKGYTYVLTVRHLFDYLDVEDCLVDLHRISSFGKRHLLNVWTIDSKEKLDAVKGKVDMITFQYPLTVDDIKNAGRIH